MAETGGIKILVLGSRVPWPLHDGGAIATYNMLKEMNACGADVTYFTFNTKKHFVSENEIQNHFPFCRVMTNYIDADPSPIGAFLHLVSFRNYNISRFIDHKSTESLEKLLQKEHFDIIHFEGLYATPLMIAVQDSHTPKVYRAHNVEYNIWEKLANASGFLKRFYFNSLARGLKKYEVKSLGRMDAIVSITPSDEATFRSWYPSKNYFYYPAGIQVGAPENLNAHVHSLGHIGSMEWMPNVEAVKWFIQNILPQVLQKYPDTEFHIAGKSLDKNDPVFQQKGIVNHGEVENSLEFHRNYRISVVPISSGSGLRMKTLESMALGKVVISSPTGAEGIPYENGKNILIANSVEEWLEKISLCFDDPSVAEKIGESARELILREYSQKTNTEKLLAFYRKMIGH